MFTYNSEEVSYSDPLRDAAVQIAAGIASNNDTSYPIAINNVAETAVNIALKIFQKLEKINPPPSKES